MPEFVDRIVVVNDNSSDATADIVKRYIEQDGKETVPLPSVLNNIQKKTKYNRADWVVQEQMKKELEFFPASEIVNEDDSDHNRIILIN